MELMSPTLEVSKLETSIAGRLRQPSNINPMEIPPGFTVFAVVLKWEISRLFRWAQSRNIPIKLATLEVSKVDKSKLGKTPQL